MLQSNCEAQQAAVPKSAESPFGIVLADAAETNRMSGAPAVGAPEAKISDEPAIVLTPKTGPAPRINGAKVFGVRPHAPFLFTIPATGVRPMSFAVKDLPEGLTVNSENGQMTGSLAKKGEYVVTLCASNAVGAAQRKLRIICGDKIALTPPMGWNSWYCLTRNIGADKVLAAADAMVNKELINHGWTYINLDDCWAGKRDSEGNMQSNERFPDMKDLTDYIHHLGLKAGIYSSPGPTTCAGYTASYEHEEQDARRFGEWGFDYLKYDWCSYGMIAPKPPDLAAMRKPYEVMRAALNKVPRDIVFSLCQAGMGDVWEWGAEPGVGGNCWRTTGDINSTWKRVSSIGFKQAGLEKYASPGSWNDPDMLLVGKIGWDTHVRSARLTPNEQYTQVSLWCLLSAPLLLSCDMTSLDDFTLSLLTNDEVLEVNQDPLGRQAGRIWQGGLMEVWAKDMEDGSKAVGLFNRSPEEATVRANWSDLGLRGQQSVRDLWRQKDLGTFEAHFSASVPRHGVVLVKIRAAK